MREDNIPTNKVKRHKTENLGVSDSYVLGELALNGPHLILKFQRKLSPLKVSFEIEIAANDL